VFLLTKQKNQNGDNKAKLNTLAQHGKGLNAIGLTTIY